MIKINGIKLNNVIIALGILAIFVFGMIIMPAKASAAADVIHAYGSTQNMWPTLSESQNYNQNYYYPAQPTQYNSAVYSNNLPANQTGKTQTAPVTHVNYTYVYDSRTAPGAPGTQTANAIDAYSSFTSQNETANQNANQAATETVDKTENSARDYAGVTANAIFGSSRVYPSGLVQWVFFAILFLIIVILVRKIFGADKKYLSTPLKHA